MTASAIGSIDAFEDRLLGLPFDSMRQGGQGVPDVSDGYQDAYTATWFPVPGEMITCGLRTDLPRKQRVHDYVSLGPDFKNKGTEGICEVLVFACTVCGRDYR